jgi:hypothetical protein
MAGKKTFLCYAAEDEHRVPALLAALDAWDVSFQLLNPTQQPAEALRAETANEIRDCEAYVRVCTSATRGSAQVVLADEIFVRNPLRWKGMSLDLDSTAIQHTGDGVPLWLHSPFHHGTLTRYRC